MKLRMDWQAPRHFRSCTMLLTCCVTWLHPWWSTSTKAIPLESIMKVASRLIHPPSCLVSAHPHCQSLHWFLLTQPLKHQILITYTAIYSCPKPQNCIQTVFFAPLKTSCFLASLWPPFIPEPLPSCVTPICPAISYTGSSWQHCELISMSNRHPRATYCI